jgi:hypothetical protein
VFTTSDLLRLGLVLHFGFIIHFPSFARILSSHFCSAVRNQLSTRLERFGRSKRKYLVREYSQRSIINKVVINYIRTIIRSIMENTDMQILISIIEPFEDIIDCLKIFQRQYNYLICTLLYHSCSTPKHVTKTRSATTSSAATTRLCCRRMVRLNLARDECCYFENGS